MADLELIHVEMFAEDGDPSWHAGQIDDGRRVHAAASADRGSSQNRVDPPCEAASSRTRRENRPQSHGEPCHSLEGKFCTGRTRGPLRSPSAGIQARPRASRQRSEIPQPQPPPTT